MVRDVGRSETLAKSRSRYVQNEFSIRLRLKTVQPVLFVSIFVVILTITKETKEFNKNLSMRFYCYMFSFWHWKLKNIYHSSIKPSGNQQFTITIDLNY
jgi:hypothetical protein